ncbi:cold shock domain-containing protein [Streptomyces sp. Je 1-79]|uniref:cold shock domain-containing protein n=1 Tax=Streptomyces sp. Je 1-79 TaxID=2943847 RepID=UPI0021A7BF5E|nr:cold shock domain-containing protein [Streptomyces sp. Je 1-79]MCT4353560.1 cold shock domain-containing protein [Streptomyces sp. Je 1-79]
MNGRRKGLVQYFNQEGGYGFITPYGDQDTVYVRAEDIETEDKVLSEGQQVTFALELGEGRFEARHVRP